MGIKILILTFFFEIKESKITRGHNFTLVKKQSRPRLDVRKFSFSQRTINVLNTFSEKCEEEETLFVNGMYNNIVWVQSSTIKQYSRTPLIRPPSESDWCGRIRGMVAGEGFVYKQKALSVTQNVVV